MSNTWIKICGITRAEDALAAAELGADAIGLNFYSQSPRSITLQEAAAIVKDLPQKIEVVALFVNPDAEFVYQLVKSNLIDLLQFHGDESPEFCEQFSTPYMKAIAVKDSRKLNDDLAQYNSAKYILLDSYDPDLHGGTGKTFDWEKTRQLAGSQQARLVLAGGLHADNVQTAIRAVRPFGVDVSSGVEASKGIKDLSKMKSFIRGVRTSG